MMRPLMTPLEDATLAFLRAIEAWEKSLKRKDMDERARVAGALAAYQRQLDACAIIAATPTRGPDA